MFCVYCVHLSILVMIAGALIGSFFGLDADVNINEGEMVNAVRLAGEKGIYNLDFLVRCDKFAVEFYDNGTPKTYRSDLSFIRNGRVEYQDALLVNHPLTFANLRFYQSSYGTAPGTKVILTYSADRQTSGELVLAPGDTFALPQYNAKPMFCVWKKISCNWGRP